MSLKPATSTRNSSPASTRSCILDMYMMIDEVPPPEAEELSVAFHFRSSASIRRSFYLSTSTSTSPVIFGLWPTRSLMIPPAKWNKLLHFPIAPFEEIDTRQIISRRIEYITERNQLCYHTYPLVIPFVRKQKMFHWSVELSQLQIEVRCQLTGQCFFMRELKTRTECNKTWVKTVQHKRVRCMFGRASSYLVIFSWWYSLLVICFSLFIIVVAKGFLCLQQVPFILEGPLGWFCPSFQC